MRPAAALLVLSIGSACFEAWRLPGSYACNPDETCPEGRRCDRTFDGPAICCDPRSEFCPTLRRADTNRCADGSSGAPYLRDVDGDGYGNPSDTSLRCARPPGHAALGQPFDCDDTRADVNPTNPELCNGRDDNCNGEIDETLTPQVPFGRDDDGDGYPVTTDPVFACMAPPGTVALAAAPEDCQPFDPSRHPGAGERCDRVDDDCDRRLDAGTYLDAQRIGEAERFPCNVENASGICRPGVWTCPSGVERVCAPLQGPRREVCDGIDTDCDGARDNQPGCGGPKVLANQPGLVYGGGLVSGGTELTTRCQKGRAGLLPGTFSAGTLRGSRMANSPDYLVWWVETTDPLGWDLSAANLKLQLQFTASGGNWGVSPGDGTFPTVYLCGDDATDLVRFRWNVTTSAFMGSNTSFNGPLPLDFVGNDVQLGIGSGFDTRKVRRVEVMVRFQGTSYEFTMGPTAGFLK